VREDSAIGKVFAEAAADARIDDAEAPGLLQSS
jgi:hypothetical protein